jgi:hypothetical protein
LIKCYILQWVCQLEYHHTFLSDVPSKPDIYVRRLPKHYPYFFAFRDVNVANFLTKGNIMHLSVHAGFLIAIVGAVTISPMGMARAQDVKSLCARVTNDDRVRPIPITLVPPARQSFSFSDSAPDGYVQKSTSFRCMEGKVWLCNTGANLVCGKANASRTSAGAGNFCKQNPGSDVVPMAATGHDTIYEWKCVGSKAAISKQAETVDPRGFIADNWKQID